MIIAHGCGNFGQIARLLGWYNDGLGSRNFIFGFWQVRGKGNICFGSNQIQNGMVQGSHAVIIILRCDCAKYRHFFRGRIPGIAVALNLFADIANGVFTAPFFKFVDHHQVCEIEHINFFQLACGPKFTGHDIHGNIDQIDNVGITLTDTGCFGNYQIITGGFDNLYGFSQGGRYFSAGLACCQAAHIYAFVADGVHADTIT